MHPTITVTLVDGVRVVVPDTLDLITPYVLQEQQDWFEDEIKFLRRLLRPGQHVIDIGANYGVYALSMAQAVGPAGRVWAFEPASGTASLLAAGIDSVQPREALGDWIAAATLEEFERAGSYTGMAAQRRLEIIRKLGYGSAEMQRRLSML